MLLYACVHFKKEWKYSNNYNTKHVYTGASMRIRCYIHICVCVCLYDDNYNMALSQVLLCLLKYTAYT